MTGNQTVAVAELPGAQTKVSVDENAPVQGEDSEAQLMAHPFFNMSQFVENLAELARQETAARMRREAKK
jgi:hypothetical protein